MALAEFPQPRDDDPEDVHWALTTAASLQARGDMSEALRWLRKAVAAAVATDQDSRAIELGRCAADLEDSLVSAPTGRGEELEGVATDPDGVPSALSRLQSGQLDMHSAANVDDDLDPPTHVDFRRHHHVDPGPATTEPTAPSHAVPTARAGQPGDGGVESQTLVPFTKKAAGVSGSAGSSSSVGVSSSVGSGGVRRVEPPAAPAPAAAGPTQVAAARSAGARTLGSNEPGDEVDLDDELTLAVRIAPNMDELGTDPDGREALENHEKTMPAMTSLARFRVALVASADGGEARIIHLRSGDAAPAGAGVAMLIPSSSQDAARVASLLAGDDKDN